MKILLIGATGMVGSRILVEAVTRNHTVVAATRNPKKIEARAGVSSIALDVTDADAVAKAARDVDIIISAVSPRNSSNAVKDAADFTEALIDASKLTGKRVLMVGGGSSLNMPNGASCLDSTPESILPEATGMRSAYAMLVSADIDFTVLAPGGMINPGERTNSFRLGDRTILVDSEGNKSKISAEDYAIAMLDEAEKPKHFRTIFNVAY